MNATTILRDSIKVLKRLGWTKHTYQNAKGNVCAVGAMRVAAYGTTQDLAMHSKSEYLKARKMVQAVVEKRSGEPKGIGNYNDHTARSVDDIISLFEEASLVED
jgi:hypothetical protein